MTAQLDELDQKKNEVKDKASKFGNDREEINTEIDQCKEKYNQLKADERNKKHEKQALQSEEKRANQENNELGIYKLIKINS